MLKSVTEAPIAAAAAATAFSISSHTAISFATVASQNNTDQHYDSTLRRGTNKCFCGLDRKILPAKLA